MANALFPFIRYAYTNRTSTTFFSYYYTKFELDYRLYCFLVVIKLFSVDFSSSSISPISCTSSARNAGNLCVQIHLKIYTQDISTVIFMHNTSNLVQWMIKVCQPTSVDENAPCIQIQEVNENHNAICLLGSNNDVGKRNPLILIANVS